MDGCGSERAGLEARNRMLSAVSRFPPDAVVKVFASCKNLDIEVLIDQNFGWLYARLPWRAVPTNSLTSFFYLIEGIEVSKSRFLLPGKIFDIEVLINQNFRWLYARPPWRAAVRIGSR